MNNEEFNNIFAETIAKCERVLCHKAGEYADDVDRLHNFKVAAEVQGCIPLTALGGMMAKHIVSVYDFIRRCENGEVISSELWDEKIIDSMNYLILLRAAIADNMANAGIQRVTTQLSGTFDTEDASYDSLNRKGAFIGHQDQDDKFHCDYLER